MSNAENAYQPPGSAAKPASSEACGVKHRDIALFVLLNFLTFGIYWFYLCYCWAKEVNGLLGRAKYQPTLVLLASILTCGLAGVVFEILFAIDIAEAAESRGVKGRMDQLATWVISTNVVAIIAATTAIGAVVGVPLGVLASVFVQVELNKLASLFEPT